MCLEVLDSRLTSQFYGNAACTRLPFSVLYVALLLESQAVKGCIWLFEQEQALVFSSVSNLKDYGSMHPLLQRRSAFRKFPRARIWVAPRQWSWPLNFPLEFFGIFRAKTLKDGDLSTLWAVEIEQKVLNSPEVGIGPYVEVAFYHKRSRTLLVTDAVIYVPRQPLECIGKESLLASAENGLAVKLLSKGKEVPQEPVVDNKMNRQKGWERMVLQILFLGPSNLLEPNASFAQMSQKLIVSPIVKTLVFSKVPEKVRDWIDSTSRDWRFKRIIPAHFSAPINASRSDFLAAFAFLDDLLVEDTLLGHHSLFSSHHSWVKLPVAFPRMT
ncbi:hypothetical protein Acr_27g0010090 [Actinidia rufa]|uniref:Uncharacterized protein n=1 Tax=Actinidia rufa TaxID=165716 RepID=A0A7J0H840_9ERIC|nr:hypothetical protein Acr_27g0010090 [Actinidia rufa]